jgi:uncharacterized protein YcnI
VRTPSGETLSTAITPKTTKRSRFMRLAAIVVFLVLAGAGLGAHVTVGPRESQAGAEQRYTVRVPTEGQVATVAVELEVPPDVTVIDVASGDGYTFETKKEGTRIVAITWRREIPPRQTAEFGFTARNPKSGQVAWKAHQRFADGTSADWVGVEGDRRPAAVTRLTAAR